MVRFALHKTLNMKTIFTRLIFLTLLLANLSTKAQSISCSLVGLGSSGFSNCDTVGDAYVRINGATYPCQVIYTKTDTATNVVFRDTIILQGQVMFPGALLDNLKGIGTITISVTDSANDTCSSSFRYAFFNKQMPTISGWHYTSGTTPGKFNLIINYNTTNIDDTLRYATFYLYKSRFTVSPPDYSKTVINIAPNSSDSIVFTDIDTSIYSLNGGGPEFDCLSSSPYIFENYPIPYTVGINSNVAVATKINLMPNPAIDWTTIAIGNELTGAITVYDIIGNTVAKEKLVNGKAQLNTSILANGTYIIVASTNQNKSVVKLVVAHR